VAECIARKASLIANAWILRSRRVRRSCVFAAAILLSGSQGLQTAVADGDTRTLTMHHVHTDETITITYKRNGRYDEAALKKLNWFLRDWRRQEQIDMDPHLFDIIWEVDREVGAQKPVEVVCGYRSPQTNAMLRRRSGGVARFSQHMLGHAMDFYIPGVSLEDIRVVGLRLQRGGVGYYPTSGSPFVHLDTGNVRHWPRMSREQLVRVFPDGRTVHIPSDGRPMAGYALALADIEKRGNSPSAMSLATARDSGVNIGEKPQSNLLAALFNLRQDKEEDEDNDSENGSQEGRVIPVAERQVTASVEPKRQLPPSAAVARPKSPASYQLASVPTATSASSAPQRSGSAAERSPVSPWSTLADAPQDGPVSDDALAYAAPMDSASQTRLPAARAAPMGVNAPRSYAASLNSAAATTIVQRSLAALPPTKPAAPPQVPTVAAAHMPVFEPAEDGNALEDPWLRALVLAPNLKSFMTVTAFEAPDFRQLSPMMEKPAITVKMTFSADPNTTPPPDHFSGSAVVFLSTVNFLTRTASLQ
jgi:uncharacterized protein YcbK (DUF882 family)